jgi:hypothetical protein
MSIIHQYVLCHFNNRHEGNRKIKEGISTTIIHDVYIIYFQMKCLTFCTLFIITSTENVFVRLLDNFLFRFNEKSRQK